MKSKNKIVIKDEFGDRWFVHKKGYVEPTHWKKQCLLMSAICNKEEIHEKLYGKRK
jgi:hypothetical protein